MPRQLRLIFPATLLAICVVFSGCKTVYSDMYSPRRSYFVPPKVKAPEDIPTPVETTAPTTTPETPAGLLPPAPPSAAPVTAPADAALPAIPGLNP